MIEQVFGCENYDHKSIPVNNELQHFLYMSKTPSEHIQNLEKMRVGAGLSQEIFEKSRIYAVSLKKCES